MSKLTKKIKLLLLFTFTLALCGCGKSLSDTAEIPKDLSTQESQTEQEYPKIVFIKNASYYGTEEKCEVVPRKSPDGVIEAFVNAKIMPDVDGYANFGSEQGKLEYMFVEDGRLIVHIGEDWCYFEKKGENTAVENDSSVSINDVTYKTYEVEIFDGTIVKIDATNIISQEKVDKVLETTLVPADAEIIAPGRDYVYLADTDNYYVEDAVDQLLTIAKKNSATENVKLNDDTEEYSSGEYAFDYSKTSFEKFENSDTASVTFSYCKEGVQTAGSNAVTFSVVKNAKPKEFLEEKVEAAGGKKSDIMEVSLATISEMCYTYIQQGSSNESGLTTSQILYAIPRGNDVVFVDGFRTIGSDEGVEMSIDKAFEQIMQTLVLK